MLIAPFIIGILLLFGSFLVCATEQYFKDLGYTKKLEIGHQYHISPYKAELLTPESLLENEQVENQVENSCLKVNIQGKDTYQLFVNSKSVCATEKYFRDIGYKSELILSEVYYLGHYGPNTYPYYYFYNGMNNLCPFYSPWYANPLYCW